MQQPDDTLAFRPRVQLAADMLRPTRAEISLASLAHNLSVVKEAAGSAKVLAVIKADAYGHGVAPVARQLESAGVDGFGVALAEEGLELREAGLRKQIVVLNGVYGGAHREVLDSGLVPVVYDLEQIEAFAQVCRGEPFGVHLKVDTGMARLGVPHRRLEGFLDGLAKFPTARIDGFMTHFSSADSDPEYTALQQSRFAEALRRVARRGHAPQLVHAANSAALFNCPDARHDMVRPGIALFGSLPSGMSANEQARSLEPVLRLRTEIIALRDVEQGDSVGYDRTFRAPAPRMVATVPIGYGDGVPRGVSNRGVMLVNGRRCPIIGRVSMDLTTLDVSDLPVVRRGDEVVVVGRQGEDQIHPSEVAAWAGTTLYEVMTSISRRVPRTYA